MLVHQAFRFELDPNNRTRAALSSHAGASRFAYNWGLALVKARLEQREQVRRAALRELLPDGDVERLARTIDVPWNLPALRKEWNREKAETAPWWVANSKEAYSSGLDALARALEGWSKSRAGARAGTVGFPRFKKKRVRKSCRFTTGAIRVRDDRHVQLPRVGVVRVKEQTGKLRELLDTGRARICSATVSEQTGRWFVSFTCELERTDAPARLPDAVVGVDLGVKVLAALSTGELVANPKVLGRYERKMARLSREQSRRQKGSKRRRQTRAKLARCHARVANTRRDALHKLTSALASNYGTVVVEDLNVAGMTAAPKPRPEADGGHAHNGRRAKAGLNRAVLDVSPAELRRQLTYKLAWRGGTLVVADRFFPSSKTCSSCRETKTKLSLATRTYRCEHCGLETDRDLNAALNLAAYGRRVLEESHHVAGSGPETVNARGGGHPRHLPKPPVKREDGTARADKAVTASSQGEAA
ncbi:MAG TPA: IS607 family element RNA-guided endonuclease TnpB [Acidimicrobiales bacterium]|nr:IS607 family element RNA-guided endonuclease TnpB [Acidimicrobiales bacterium]